MESEVDMTPSEQFAAWLAPALRAAGYDIDRQHSGARTAFAKAVDVAPATITRWLSGTAMPAPDKFEVIAHTLGVTVIEMLVGTGIVSANSVTSSHDPAVRSRPISPSEAADALGIDDPIEREMFLGTVERLKRSRIAPVPRNGGAATAEG